MKRLYLSGPMSGLPDSNVPTFNAEAERLRARGYEVVNPAENGLPADSAWATHMRADIAAMMTCDELVYLPGSFNSRGAWIEMELAMNLGMPMTSLNIFLSELAA